MQYFCILWEIKHFELEQQVLPESAAGWDCENHLYQGLDSPGKTADRGLGCVTGELLAGPTRVWDKDPGTLSSS